MNNRQKKIFYKIITKNILDKNNCLEVCVEYNLGGYNCFTGIEERRGWYFSMSPCEVDAHTVAYTAFTGKKVLIQECIRNSKRQKEKALLFMEENKEKLFQEWFGNQYETDWQEF